MWAWETPLPNVPLPPFAKQFPGGASRLSTRSRRPEQVEGRLAALLLGHRCPMCSLVAPCQPGAAPGTYSTNYGNGTLERFS